VKCALLDLDRPFSAYSFLTVVDAIALKARAWQPVTKVSFMKSSA
jgi:hypothetical protein